MCRWWGLACYFGPSWFRRRSFCPSTPPLFWEWLRCFSYTGSQHLCSRSRGIGDRSTVHGRLALYHLAMTRWSQWGPVCVLTDGRLARGGWSSSSLTLYSTCGLTVQSSYFAVQKDYSYLVLCFIILSSFFIVYYEVVQDQKCHVQNLPRFSVLRKDR